MGFFLELHMGLVLSFRYYYASGGRGELVTRYLKNSRSLSSLT